MRVTNWAVGGGRWLFLAALAGQACFYNPTGSGPVTSETSSSGEPVLTTAGTTTTVPTTDPTTDPTTGPTTDSTETMATTLPAPECVEARDCGEAAAPFCVDGSCVACDQTAEPGVSCAGKDSTAPVCDAGTCVECSPDDKMLCQGIKPLCGPDNLCIGCTEHSECPDTACNLETGACLDVDHVLHVDAIAACNGADGSVDAPFCKITEAFTKMVAGDVAAGWTLKIRGGSYVEDPLIVPAYSIVAMIRWDGVEPKIRATPGSDSTLTVNKATRLFIDSLAFNLNDEFNGIVCEGAKVWIDDSRVASNHKQGYQSTDCDTRIRRSVIFKNLSGGLASYGGQTWITNSYVTGNGTQNLDDYGGIRSAQGNVLHLLYSIVVNNLIFSGPRSLQCTPDAGPAEVRNSVLIAAVGLPSIDCPGGTFSHSALDEGAIDGDSNLVATYADIMNFFNLPMNGVYTAKPDTGLKDLAVWKTGDPATDFDGTARPGRDGAPDYAGADRP